MSDNSDPLEIQQEQVRLLCRQRRFDTAADLAATLSDEILIFTPCEEIADRIRAERPALALRLYEIAAALWRYEGTQATGSGEGIAAMDHLRRVEDKQKALLQKGTG